MQERRVSTIARTPTAPRARSPFQVQPPRVILFKELHISPITVHLSFSQGGSKKKGVSKKKKKGGGGIANIPTNFIGSILKDFGVTLTELQDVVFSFSHLTRRNVTYTRDMLSEEMATHYTSELLKQFYVIFLGFDIIGNPYGLAQKLTAGVKDLVCQFVHGPEELGEGITIGTRSLCNNIVEGTSGAVSRIVGTLGKVLATLTFDEEYQRKRQEAMNKKPESVCEGLFRGAKGFINGTYKGVTGVVIKPYEGARKDGIGGFAKGVGVGLIGVVTRPISGLVDLVSGTFDAFKRSEGRPVRPPRNMKEYIYRPFQVDVGSPGI